jgi:hypothetical protein
VSTADQSAAELAYNSFLPKFALFAISIASTLLMLESRELLDAATSGDKSDGAYIYGM